MRRARYDQQNQEVATTYTPPYMQEYSHALDVQYRPRASLNFGTNSMRLKFIVGPKISTNSIQDTRSAQLQDPLLHI